MTKLWNLEMNASYNIIMNKYLSVVGRSKKLSDAEWIIKLVSSSVEELIFRDWRSEIYIPFEEKTSASGKNRILIALDFTEWFS